MATCQPPQHDKDHQQREEYDYVIVGAGAAAMGLVNGLLYPFKKSSPSFTIAVLERGNGPPHAAATEMPNQWCNASHKPSNSVRITDSLIGNRVIDVPVGQGLGGTTNINACLCCPPARDDFDTWPAPWNKSIMTSVRVLQDEMITNDALYLYDADDDGQHSAGVTDPKRETLFPSLVRRVLLSLDTRESNVLNGKLVRRNYYEALVEPLLRDYPHLQNCITFLKDFQVNRLLFSKDNVRVVGVEGPKRIYARRVVILCAGAIESPALLLVSGIGHKQDLQEAGIQPRGPTSCIGVGRRLRDHVLVPRVFLSRSTNRTLSPNGVYALYYDCKDEHRFQYIFNDAAVYPQLVPHFVASFVRRRITFGTFIMVSTAVSWILNGLFLSCRVLLMLLVSYTPLYFLLRYHIITMNVALLNAKSTGTVTIRRRNSSDAKKPLGRKDVDVLVDAGYLSDPRDTTALFQGWNCSSQRLHLFLRSWIELLPGFFFRVCCLNDSTDPTWFQRYASHFALPYFHWCGTCAMKTDSNIEWVVDSSLRVRDIPGLRVCDASVFPTTISGPTALTCAALGHILAGLLLQSNDKKHS